MSITKQFAGIKCIAISNKKSDGTAYKTGYVGVQLEQVVTSVYQGDASSSKGSFIFSAILGELPEAKTYVNKRTMFITDSATVIAKMGLKVGEECLKGFRMQRLKWHTAQSLLHKVAEDGNYYTNEIVKEEDWSDAKETKFADDPIVATFIHTADTMNAAIAEQQAKNLAQLGLH